MKLFITTTALAWLSLAASLNLPTRNCSELEETLDNSENVQINATTFPAGTLNITGLSAINNVSICRISGVVKYGIKLNNTLSFEVWLPEASSYNGRYLSVGNGGFAGTIDYSSMMQNLRSGYAVGGCDSGHPATSNGESKPGSYVEFLNNRDETLAWLHNSIATFTEPAKKLTTAYYGKDPIKMYYSGCSTGGAQGFALAQFHPEVFDGIYAGSPGNWYSHLILSFLWNYINSNKSDAFIPQDALNLITSTVLTTCNATDGVLQDPTKCTFNISTLACSPNQSPTTNNKTTCLTPTQISNTKNFYGGPKNPRTGAQVYPGFAFGSEREWMDQESTLGLSYGVPILQNLVFANLSYDPTTFNWDTDIHVVDRNAGTLIDAISPSLHSFKKRGGKIMVSQGWADPYNSPFWPIVQYEEVRRVFGEGTERFYRLFMVPGGGHCGGAESYPGVPAVLEVLDRLVPWVEGGAVPGDLVAGGPADGSGRTVTLLPYMGR